MKALALAIFFVMFATTAGAVDVDLFWDPNTEEDLAGYNVYQAKVTGNHSTAWTHIAAVLAPTVTHTVFGLPDNTNFIWHVTAYDTGGQESLISNVVWRWKPKPGHPTSFQKQEP